MMLVTALKIAAMRMTVRCEHCGGNICLMDDKEVECLQCGRKMLPKGIVKT